MADSDPIQKGMRIVIRFYQAQHRAYTVYISDEKRIQSNQHFRSPLKALNYVNELIAQGHTVSSPEDLQRLTQEARHQTA